MPRYAWLTAYRPHLPSIRMEGHSLPRFSFFELRPRRSPQGTQPNFITMLESEPALKMVVQIWRHLSLKRGGVKTGYFRVVLRRRRNLSANIFGTKQVIDKLVKDFVTTCTNGPLIHAFELINFGTQTAEISWLLFTHPLQISHFLNCRRVYTEVTECDSTKFFRHVRCSYVRQI